MTKANFNFFLKLFGFSLGLYAIHYYILIQFFTGSLILPLWLIYSFNALLVFIVFSLIKYSANKKNKNLLNTFLILTIIKMVLILILLLPLFLNKSAHLKIEVFNFFIPYFAFLTFEIFSLNKFLQKS